MIKNTHPQYDANLIQWEELRDAAAGPAAIKARLDYYISPSRGMLIDGALTADTKSTGHQAYLAYVKRATYPSIFADTITKVLGILHKKPAVIKLPPAMASLYVDADGSGQSIYEVLRRINKNQLITGRLSVLADVTPIDNTNKMRPIVSLYNETSTRMWRTQNNKTTFVILDETGPQFDEETYSYKQTEQFRVIRLVEQDNGKMLYTTATGKDENVSIDDLDFYAPNVFGTTISELPFSFCNAGTTTADITDPPLLGLKDISLCQYRAAADLNSALFSTASETLVISGRHGFGDDDEEEVRVGAGSVINLPSGGSANYIGPQSVGLSEMRLNLSDLRDIAQSQSASLSVQSASNRDSAEALSLRGSSMSASYATLVLAGAESLQQALRALAPIFGADPESVLIKPNLDFVLPEMQAKSFVELSTAKNLGLKISDKSIHELMVSRGISTNDYETEQKLLAAEESLLDL